MIWLYGLGYFAFYAPYSALTKSLSNGSLYGDQQAVSGIVLLPATLLTTALTVTVFLLISGWWRYAARRTLFGLRLPVPGLWPALSGLGTAGIIATTTLAYTFEGVSIVLALLLMRGGVLVMSPIIDRVFGREVQWYSWTALSVSLVALVVALTDTVSTALSVAFAINLLFYLLGYVIRLQSMTRVAKSDDRLLNRRYLVEEQLVSIPALLLVPMAIAWFGSGSLSSQLSLGFTSFLISAVALPAYCIGILYGCLFVFGSLIYLDCRENTFCVPVWTCRDWCSANWTNQGGLSPICE